MALHSPGTDITSLRKHQDRKNVVVVTVIPPGKTALQAMVGHEKEAEFAASLTDGKDKPVMRETYLVSHTKPGRYGFVPCAEVDVETDSK